MSPAANSAPSLSSSGSLCSLTAPRTPQPPSFHHSWATHDVALEEHVTSARWDTPPPSPGGRGLALRRQTPGRSGLSTLELTIGGRSRGAWRQRPGRPRSCDLARGTGSSPAAIEEVCPRSVGLRAVAICCGAKPGELRQKCVSQGGS